MLEVAGDDKAVIGRRISAEADARRAKRLRIRALPVVASAAAD